MSGPRIRAMRQDHTSGTIRQGPAGGVASSPGDGQVSQGRARAALGGAGLVWGLMRGEGCLRLGPHAREGEALTEHKEPVAGCLVQMGAPHAAVRAAAQTQSYP